MWQHSFRLFPTAYLQNLNHLTPSKSTNQIMEIRNKLRNKHKIISFVRTLTFSILYKSLLSVYFSMCILFTKRKTHALNRSLAATSACVILCHEDQKFEVKKTCIENIVKNLTHSNARFKGVLPRTCHYWIYLKISFSLTNK